MERIKTGAGFSLLDVGALVTGAAIASIHLTRVLRSSMTGTGWLLGTLMFCWVSLTAAGPFVFLLRKFIRPVIDYPKMGDRLWALLGLPWIITAILQSSAGLKESSKSPLFTTTLSIGLGAACMIALGVVWNTWVAASPEQAAHIEAEPWTNRVGLILSIAWPIQCGLGMVVLS